MKKKKQDKDSIPYTKMIRQNREEKEFWSRFGIADPEIAPEHCNHVDLRCSTITDNQLKLMVSRIRSIEMLDLNETEISNEGIGHLCELKYLAELRLKECRNIDNDCVPFFNLLPTLKLLYVKSTPITIEGLLHLKSENLEELYFSSHNEEITAKKIEILFSNLPKAELIIDGKTVRRGER